MAKGQKRSTREAKKPKKAKAASAAPVVELKGISESGDTPKKKKG
jgi:hypothetical protein